MGWSPQILQSFRCLFKLCANQMMALLPGYSQVSLPLTPFCLRRNHLMQLLQFFQMKKVTLRKQKRLLAQGHKYILSAFLLVVVELRVHTCTRPPTLPSLHVLMGLQAPIPCQHFRKEIWDQCSSSHPCPYSVLMPQDVRKQFSRGSVMTPDPRGNPL